MQNPSELHITDRTPTRPSTSSGQRRTYTVSGNTLHITDPVLGLSVEYPLVYLNAMIAECEAELEKYQAYRQRILAATPCPECAGTGRYGDTNFHCEWCGGTGKAASEQRAGAGEVEP